MHPLLQTWKTWNCFPWNERQGGLFSAHLLSKSSDWWRNSLAFAVLQVEMRIEVDEDPLVGTRRRYHPCASLRVGIRNGVSWRGEVAGRRDSDVASTFICRRSGNSYRDLYNTRIVNIIVMASNLRNQNSLIGIKTPSFTAFPWWYFINIKEWKYSLLLWNISSCISNKRQI